MRGDSSIRDDIFHDPRVTKDEMMREDADDYAYEIDGDNEIEDEEDKMTVTE